MEGPPENQPESAEAPKMNLEQAVSGLHRSSNGPEAVKWFDQVQADLERMRAKFETTDQQAWCQITIRMAVCSAIVKALAGYQELAIAELREIEMYESADRFDQQNDLRNLALDCVQSSDPAETKTRRLTKIYYEIQEIFEQQMKQ